jgi:hypothetical protein
MLSLELYLSAKDGSVLSGMCWYVHYGVSFDHGMEKLYYPYLQLEKGRQFVCVRT